MTSNLGAKNIIDKNLSFTIASLIKNTRLKSWASYAENLNQVFKSY